MINDRGDGNAEVCLHGPASSPHLSTQEQRDPLLLSPSMPLTTLPTPETGLICAMSLKVHGAAWVTGPEPTG